MNEQGHIRYQSDNSFANPDAHKRYHNRKATFNDLGMDETTLQQMARSGLRFNNYEVVVCEGYGCYLNLGFNASGTPNEQSPIDVPLREMKIKDVAQINKMHASSCQYSESNYSDQNLEQRNILMDDDKLIYNLSRPQGRLASFAYNKSDVSYYSHSVEGLYFDENKKSLECYYCEDSLPEAGTVSKEIFEDFFAKHQKSVRTDSRHPRADDPSSAGAHSSPPPPPAPGQPGVAQSTPGQTHGQVVSQLAQLSINDTESNTPSVNLTWNPKYPQYSNLQTRIDTFSPGSGWPSDKSQTPVQLAKAGVFYDGSEDKTRCFDCGGGLKNWANGDDPFVEHARHYPECAYLIRNMGPTFINNVQAAEQQCKENARINQTPRASSDVSDGWESEPTVSAVKHTVSAIKQMGYLLNQIRPAYDLVRSREHKVDEESLPQEIFRQEEEANERNSVSAARAGEPIAAQQHSGHQTPKPEERNSASGGEWSEADRTALREENHQPRGEQRLCNECLKAKPNIAFLPCGHLVTCNDCAPSLETCPICKQIIRGNVKVFR